MSEAATQVLLVGAAQAEASARAAGAAGVERVDDTLQAVARLHELAATGAGLAVVVAAEAIGEPGEATDLVRGLRLAAPRARLVLLDDRAQQNGHPFDAVLSPGASSGAWRDALGLAPAATPRAPAAMPPAHEEQPAPQAPDPPQSERPPPQAATGADAPPDERDVVMAMLQARDPIESALQLIGRALAVPATFTSDPGAEGEPVAWGDRTYGRLAAPGASPDALRAQAQRLAAWLRLNEQHAELRRAALTDPLTGAWNRRYFDRFLAVTLDQARRRRGSVTLLVFDIDDFKLYNEKYGHGAGDEILVETVRLLRSVTRPTDKVCRIGGDEFAVIFHEPQGPREPGSRPPESVYQISRRFQTQICEHRFPKLADEAPGTLTISGGLATYPWDGRDAADLLEQADQLALESKRIGKNAITLGPGAALLCGADTGSHPGDHHER